MVFNDTKANYANNFNTKATQMIFIQRRCKQFQYKDKLSQRKIDFHTIAKTNYANNSNTKTTQMIFIQI